MKSRHLIILPLLAVLIAGNPSQAAEMRKVGNAEVDLQPLIDWTTKKKGERPLKHWKLIQVLELKHQSVSPELICDIEGTRTEIILRNCPSELLNLLRRKTDLEARIAAARKDEGAAAENLNEAHNKRQARQAKRSNTAAREAQKASNKDLDDVDKKIKQQKIFAMSTGATYGGLPVWDTGLQTH